MSQTKATSLWPGEKIFFESLTLRQLLSKTFKIHKYSLVFVGIPFNHPFGVFFPVKRILGSKLLPTF